MMNIGLLGFGVVGRGVYAQAEKRSDLHISRVLVRRDIPEIAAIATRDFQDIVTDSSIHTVVEVLGGLHPAYEYISAALRAGKHVVTANKAVVSAYYKELTALAQENHVALRCTAAVGGGIPWLVNLERCCRLDTVDEVCGIMNGTSNYIMDAMHKSPVNFDEVLHKVQELGYAEADPSADIDGDDIRRKLVISANIAFSTLLCEEDVPMFGIRNVTAQDIAAFQEHGYVCKLMATARRTPEGVAAWLEPTLVSANALEAAVPANYNLISFQSQYLGRQSYFGQGAGRFPTASNVTQDCLDIAAGKTAFYAPQGEVLALHNDAIHHTYYVRTDCADPWLTAHTREKMASGILTDEVSVEEMHTWVKAQLQRDSNCFIAALN